jgi:hypothetical protein
VLFTYVTLHLINHAFGMVSLALAERGLRIAMAFWRIAGHQLRALWRCHGAFRVGALDHT